MLRAVLFDLDGTIADSAPIITRTIGNTMRELAGLDQPDSAYRRYVGPPLNESFAHLGVPADEITSYIAHYKAAYAKVHHATPVFDGVPELLGAVRDAGFAVGLATSKMEDVAKVVVENLGLTDYFDVLCGSLPGEVELGKPAVVATALTRLHDAGLLEVGVREKQGMDSPLRDDVVMVGDRIYDIEGARLHGIRTILATWGDSWPEEEKLAWRTASTADEVLEILLDARENGIA
ncbi:HAD hydrolase-like protein [Trueperella bialowiezensis]|uniref:5'-nucleotidase n=1 Tax=Trueperella bialowiezensis TaxID=312285 RepID=A0A448PC68_9ACTO|nr:HAD hydrolase-like protein [Trueperella bialowiezensis]VEI12561.1 5'-nucleotidase [Trueperella bialowiezensis]